MLKAFPKALYKGDSISIVFSLKERDTKEKHTFEVGDIIKPLWHVEIPTYGGKRLVKYAASTMTNSMMQNSELS